MKRARHAWQPVLHGDDAARARRAIDDIASVLREVQPTWRVGASLANGDAGLAICYAYLGELETAAACIERAIDKTATAPLPPSLHHGYAGVAWATEHLIGRVIEPGDDDLGAAIDDALLAHVRGATDGDFDLLNGLVGLGVYALERWPRPTARELLEAIVARLAALAERSADGACWRTPPALLDPELAARCPHGVVNLGLAHGVPCVIALLAACVDAGVATATARSLLDDAVRWLVARTLPTSSGSRFPDLVAAELAPVPARLAWCYGDLAIASALVIAGDRVDHAAWRAAGVELAHAAAARSDDTTGVRDACLCHGTAGLGLMFARLAHAAGGDAILEAAAARWYRATFAMEHREHPVRFPPFVVTADLALGDAYVGLLTGAAGVALALHAAITNVEPAWDRTLLLSLREL